MGDLHVRAQALQIVGRQGEIELATEVENGLRADVAVEMAVNVGKR